MMALILKSRAVTLPIFSPAQIDSIKLVAFLAMVADHVNTAFSLHNDWLMLIGRIAFPLFAVMWGLNQARHQQIKQTSLNRLWLWAIVAQPGYALVIMHSGSAFYQLNVLFAFAVAGQSLRWLQTGKVYETVKAVCLVLAYLPLSLTSYFIFGLLLLWFSCFIFQQYRSSYPLFDLIVWGVLVVLLNTSMGALYALSGLILSLALIGLLQGMWGGHRFLPGYFFLAGYTGHLTLLGVGAL